MVHFIEYCISSASWLDCFSIAFISSLKIEQDFAYTNFPFTINRCRDRSRKTDWRKVWIENAGNHQSTQRFVNVCLMFDRNSAMQIIRFGLVWCACLISCMLNVFALYLSIYCGHMHVGCFFSCHTFCYFYRWILHAFYISVLYGCWWVCEFCVYRFSLQIRTLQLLRLRGMHKHYCSAVFISF